MKRDLIFVVDDQPSNIEVVTVLLEQAGYEVVPSYSGEEVLEHCLQRTPGLVLLDMRMPMMDGFEVCAHLRANPRTADVPIIFLTAAQEQNSVLQAFNSGAVDYVTKPFLVEELLARVKTHIELRRARDHLALVAQERADLTQIVAHDLKNPLSSILFALDLLERGQQNPEAMLDEIRLSARHCLNFIDNYLGRWAQSDDLRQVEISPLQLGSVIRSAVDSFNLLAQERGMSIEIDIADDPPVLGNATAIRHVLANLISNALRYAGEGTCVTVRSEIGRSGMARVLVSDRGPGVPPDRQPQLFKRYVRLQAEAAVEHSSGLGLAISKEEISRMNGHLWYEDREGGGAVFCFVLPLAGAGSDPVMPS